eukprot:1186674-Prorocentrum_minimum.AAC.2
MFYIWGVECTLAVIGTGGPVKRGDSTTYFTGAEKTSFAFVPPFPRGEEAATNPERVDFPAQAVLYSHDGPIRRRKHEGEAAVGVGAARGEAAAADGGGGAARGDAAGAPRRVRGNVAPGHQKGEDRPAVFARRQRRQPPTGGALRNGVRA